LLANGVLHAACGAGRSNGNGKAGTLHDCHTAAMGASVQEPKTPQLNKLYFLQLELAPFGVSRQLVMSHNSDMYQLFGPSRLV
jgi:hypothetical protein